MKSSLSLKDRPKAIPGPTMVTDGKWTGLDDSIWSEKNGVSHGYHELYDHKGFLWYRGNFNSGNEVGYQESYGIIEGHIYFLRVYYHIQ